MGALLQQGEESPFIAVNEQGRSPFVLICEHASNTLPKALGTLGLPEADLTRHIAWDIGAEKVARLLSRLIDAPLLLQRYSRLAYDCNRPPESPDAIPEVSELTTIPGNRKLSPEDRLARARDIYRPFHDGVSAVLDRRAASGQRSLLVSIHSFTPVYKGKPRSVELGILHDRDTTLSAKLIKSFPNVDARLNEPYGPKDGVLHTLNLHGFARGLQHAMIEIRNDLVATERGQDEWAQRLSVPLIQAATK
ncbi:MAG: N-formylglutamate amidohydrolase [Hyphomicrobiales bacterium]|uniref:N-formylglutamate amidohydrolase n=1 Tax=Aestuariivirga sp. TaxID=2650926 RepID=UPI0035B481BD